MVQHVWSRCVEAACFEQVIVATDDQRIADVVKGFGGTVAMTSEHCASGSDRVAEVARSSSVGDDQVFFNVQGDEPAIHPESLRILAKAFDDASVQMGTLIRPLADEERPNPNIVKVVLDATQHALYFSRSDIPYQRDVNQPSPPRWAHLGIYAYRKATLLRVASLAPTALERAESLEQLRALAHGVRIACRVTPHGSVSVDLPQDVAGAEAALKKLRPAG